MILNKKFREKIKRINQLFSEPNFFEDLCNHSANDINKVIKNISNIINYYLVTDDTKTDYNMPELISRGLQTSTISSGFLYSPNSSYYEKKLKLTGLNPYYGIETKTRTNLNNLAFHTSVYPTIEDPFSIPIYKDIENALIESFTYPETLYKSILKQPTNQELPIVVGTSETNYYKNILEIRLKNIEDTMLKTASTIGKKALSSFIGKQPLIIVFPPKTKRYSISKKEIEKHKTGEYIPPFFIGLIRIPTKYQLINICATNKKLRNGELIDIRNGQEYKLPKPEIPPYTSIIYSRYELLPITDNFYYLNSDFTGDIDYDIDLIYGQLDSNKSRHKLSQDTAKNISHIKSRDDIIVRKIGNNYEIRNGRHRLLYLKHFYVSEKESYEKEGRLSTLKKYVTVPVNVEATINDSTANKYIVKLYTLPGNPSFYKVDINNDNPEIIVLLSNRAYYLNGTHEIIDFYNQIKESNYNNKYYIGLHDDTRREEYHQLFDHLVLTLKEKIFTMSLIDIIRYFLNNGIILENTHYNIATLNYKELYSCYNDLQHTYQVNRIFNQNKNIINMISNKYKRKKVGKIILNIINENPEYIKLSWDQLLIILKGYKELSEYDDEFLEEAANIGGYQKLKFESMLIELKYTKKPKI